jgi:hypothetical protein
MTREEREDAIDIIQLTLDKYEEDECLVTEMTIGDEDIKAFKMAIEVLEQEPILDKIRTEIENHCSLAKENHCIYCPYCSSLLGVKKILEIIDKYKAESEGQNDKS